MDSSVQLHSQQHLPTILHTTATHPADTILPIHGSRTAHDSTSDEQGSQNMRVALVHRWFAKSQSSCLEGTTTLNVSTTAEALELSDSLDCFESGHFEVNWSGNVLLSQTITVSFKLQLAQRYRSWCRSNRRRRWCCWPLRRQQQFSAAARRGVAHRGQRCRQRRGGSFQVHTAC